MDFDYSPKTKELQKKLLQFMDDHIYPAESQYMAELAANTQAGKRWTPLQTVENLKTAYAEEGARALRQLQEAAIRNENMFTVLMEATKYCSLGQLTEAMFEVGGQYRRNM